jgi:aryl-alcohol dehydrogenase-like predicted oxidoreductase
MEYRRLGRTALSVSLVSLGTGGPSQMGQTEQLAFSDQDALIHRALDLGINVFDTAMAYGHSEDLLGRALADVARDRYVLATKLTPTRVSREAYTTTPPGDTAADLIAPADVRRLCEESLRRLGTDVIDVYQVHGVTPDLYPAVVEQLYPALLDLRSAGKIRFIGITERFFQDAAHTMLETAVPSGLWDTVMLKYGILNQAAAQTVLPLCQQHQVGVLNMASVRVKLTRPAELAALLSEWRAQGLLPPDAALGDDPLGWLVHDGVASVIDAGYKFAANQPAISTVLTGTARTQHLASNVDAILSGPLPPADEARLRTLFGHLAEGA